MSYTLDDIGSMVKSFDAKLDAVKTSMEDNINALKSEIYDQMAHLQSNVQEEFTTTYNHLYESDIRIHTLEKQLIKNDIIISGIPVAPKENVFKYLEDICKAIGYAPSSNITSSFRLSPNNPTSPIIAKFANDSSKSEFFEKYFKIKGLKAAHIGLNTVTNGKIFINHCVTRHCRTLRDAAKKLSEKGHLSKIKIIRGDVYITKTGDTNSTRILHMDQLKDF